MASASPATRPRGGIIPGLLAGCVFGLLQLLLLANPTAVTLDPEELYNAAHAEAILSAGSAVILPLQYRPFCGGCTADALLGAGLFTLFGTSLLVWKLVPILLGAVAVGALTQAAWRHVSPIAGGAVAAVLLASPPAWSRLGLVAWGNHYECSAIVLMALALAAGPSRRGRDLCLGLCLGLLLWVGWSGAFAVLGLLVWIGLMRDWGRLLRVIAAGAVGFSPAILRTALTGQWPTATIYQAGETVPSLARLPGKLMGLVMPNQLAGLLGVRDPIFGPVLGVMAAVSLLVAAVSIARRPGWPRLVLGLLGTWLGIYLLVRFPVQRSAWPDVPTAGGVRYAAPAIPLAAAVVALASAALWQAGRRGRAALLLSPWLIAGLGSRLLALAPPFPNGAALDQWPGDMDFFREQASWALPIDLHKRGAVHGDERLQVVHAYALGRAAITSAMAGKDTLPDTLPALMPGPELLESPAAQDLTAAWAQGVAAAIVDRIDPTASGDARLLAPAMLSLEQLAESGWTPAMRQAALREVSW
ncbi:MAG: hypothetical protein GXP62_03160, partial [Oligoflexia bacterium]|nr:hypothetical protein [Oligoflexia bacterium]